MKKLTGWLLIIFCSFILLMFTIAIIGILSGKITNHTGAKMSSSEILSISIGFIIVITLMIWGLKNGFNKIRKVKPIETINYAKDLNITLTGKISYSDYRNLILGISFKKPIYLVLFGILLLFSISFFINKENMPDQYLVIIILGVFVLSPIISIIQIKKLYQTNAIFKEVLKYTIDNQSLTIQGETVDSRQSWNHFYMIRETKSFFMFYHGKMVATLIDKKMFTDNDLIEFSKFIKSLAIKKM